MNYYCQNDLLHAREQNNPEDIDENSFEFTYLDLVYNTHDIFSDEGEKRAIRKFKILKNTIKMASVSGYSGLYHNYPHKAANGEYVTHDTLTSICAFSHRHGLDFHKKIWNYLKKNWFFYNDKEPTGWRKFKRPFVHPRDIIFIGALNNNKWCIKLIPFLIWICKLSLKKIYKVRIQHGKKVTMIHTDGKLLSLIRADALNFRDKLTPTIKANPVLGSWTKSFAIYFQDTDVRKDHILRDTIIKE